MYSPPLPSYINSLKMKDPLTFMSNVFFFIGTLFHLFKGFLRDIFLIVS